MESSYVLSLDASSSSYSLTLIACSLKLPLASSCSFSLVFEIVTANKSILLRSFEAGPN